MTRLRHTVKTVKTQKQFLTLPDEVGSALRLLGLKERKAYCVELMNAGWTLQSIADQLNVTREAVRVYKRATTNNDSDVRQAINSLPIPQLPYTEVDVVVSVTVKAPDDVLLQLKELHNKAKNVRGKGKNNRTEAEQFTRLAWETVQSGVSIYTLAKSLGVTTAALQSRFVRYGYKTTTGTSSAYKSMQHRLQEQENENA